MKNTDNVLQKFQEANDKNYISKLIYDIDNNKDSFNISIDTFIDIFKSKVVKKISSFYNEKNVNYTISDLDELIELNLENLKKCIKKDTNDKYNDIKSKVDDSKTALKNVNDEIDKSTTNYKVKIQDDLNEGLLIKLKDSLITKFKLKDEEDLDSFIIILNGFNSEISLKINDSISHRDETLKLLTKETYNIYMDINNKTVDNSFEKVKNN